MPYRMMCLTAHPDDESGAFGGALLMAHDKGVETTVICLTEGAAGSFRGTATSDEELAQLRRDEFNAAARLLNLTHAEVLDYPDGKIDQQNFYELTGVLVEKIRKYCPQVVLTFGGDVGVTWTATTPSPRSPQPRLSTGPRARSSFDAGTLMRRKSSTMPARPGFVYNSNAGATQRAFPTPDTRTGPMERAQY